MPTATPVEASAAEPVDRCSGFLVENNKNACEQVAEDPRLPLGENNLRVCRYVYGKGCQSLPEKFRKRATLMQAAEN